MKFFCRVVARFPIVNFQHRFYATKFTKHPWINEIYHDLLRSAKNPKFRKQQYFHEHYLQNANVVSQISSSQQMVVRYAGPLIRRRAWSLQFGIRNSAEVFRYNA